MDAISQAAFDLDAEIRFGMLMFPEPSQKGADATGPGLGVHCDLDPKPQVGFALQNGDAIFNLIDPTGNNFWGGPTKWHDTPMYQALQAANGLSSLKDPDRRSYVLLITDGNQDCCIAGDYDDDPDCEPGSVVLEANEKAENIADLVGQVQQLSNTGINTFVVGIKEKVSAEALNQMAIAGGTPKSVKCDPEQSDPAADDNCFYTVNDSAGLLAAVAAISKIISEETCDGIDNDCDGDVDEDYPDLGQTCDGPDGDQCQDGVMICTEDTVSTQCDESGPGETESCDMVDNDCNGQTDESNPCPANFNCIDGTCIEDAEDNPDDLGPKPEEDLGTVQPDVQDQPQTPDAGAVIDTGPTQSDDLGAPLPVPGADSSGAGLPAPGSGGGELGEDGGCGCRQAGGGGSIPSGGILIVALLALAVTRRTRSDHIAGASHVRAISD